MRRRDLERPAVVVKIDHRDVRTYVILGDVQLQQAYLFFLVLDGRVHERDQEGEDKYERYAENGAQQQLSGA